jgi:hypothetical protein
MKDVFESVCVWIGNVNRGQSHAHMDILLLYSQSHNNACESNQQTNAGI